MSTACRKVETLRFSSVRLSLLSLLVLGACQTGTTYVSFKPGSTAGERQEAFRRCKAVADTTGQQDLYLRDRVIMACLEADGYQALDRPTCRNKEDRRRAYYDPQPDDPDQMKCSSGIAMELPAIFSTPPKPASDCSSHWYVIAQWAPPDHPCRQTAPQRTDPVRVSR